MKLRNIVFEMAFGALMTMPGVGVAQNVDEEDIDPCDDLDSNEMWVEGFTSLQDNMTKKNYKEALLIAGNLMQVCDRSPILNYYAGVAFRETGDRVKATMYFQKAANGTSEYAVPPEISRRIWYARYESEYPERTEESVNKAMAELEALRETTADQSRQLELLSGTKSDLIEATNDQNREHYKSLLWGGVGVGSAGVLATVAGGLVMAFVNNYKEVTPSKYEVSSAYVGGWALLGGGVGLILAGATAAGIAGYKLTHLESVEDATLTIAPAGASLSFKF